MSPDTSLAPSPQEQLQARLSDPRTVEALNRLLDRLDLIAFSAEMMDGFLRRGNEVADSVAEGVADVRKMVGDGPGAELLCKLPALARAGVRVADAADSPAFDRLLNSGLLEKLADPSTLNSLNILVEKLELAAFLLTAVDGFLKRGNEVADSLAAGVADLRMTAPEMGPDQMREMIGDFLILVETGHKIVKSGLLAKIEELTGAGLLLSQAGMFDPKVVNTLGEVGRMASESYAEAKAAPKQIAGLLDLWRLFRDPEAQPALSLAFEMTRRFGQKIKKSA